MFNWFFDMKDALSMAGSVAIIMGCLFLIVLLAYFTIKIPSRVIAVIVSTMGTIFLMIPTVTSFNAIVDKSATSELAKQYATELELRKKEMELVEKNKEIEKQNLVNLRQKISMETLESELTMLKSSQLKILDYREIAEVNLLETDIKDITVHREQPREFKLGDRSTWYSLDTDKYIYADDMLVILAHDMTVKFGFDINEIKIMDSEDVPNALLVSQVKPKFTGVTRDIHDKLLAEVRHNEIDIQKAQKSGVDLKEINLRDLPVDYKHISIDFKNAQRASQYADEEIKRYKECLLEQGLETKILDKPLEKICKNFVKTMLMPLNKKIIFVDEVKEGALSIEDYFNTKLEATELKIKEAKTVSSDKILQEVNEELKQVRQEKKA